MIAPSVPWNYTTIGAEEEKMDMSQISLNNALTFLVYASGIFVVVIGAFLVKLLIDLSTLVKNANTTTEILNVELKPTLQELNETLAAVNAIVKTTDRGVDNVKALMEKTFGKTKTLVSGVVQGFKSVFELFRR
jgi:predicted PurR-regulated permease PerM